MTQSGNQIAADIDRYIWNHGGLYRNWYVGIAANPRDRLFSNHNVSEQFGSWIYREAANDAVARNVEQHFVNQKGTQGGSGGGDFRTRYVYAFKIN